MVEFTVNKFFINFYIDGMWHLNKMHGKGTLYYAGGSPAYSGSFIFIII